MVERKAFPENPKHKYHISQRGEHDCSAHNKNNGVIMSIQVCLISWMTINYKKMVGRKAFLAKSKHQYRVSQ